jgi:hypothetical protein
MFDRRFVFRSRSLDAHRDLQPLAVSRASRRNLRRVVPGSGRMVAARAKGVKRNLPLCSSRKVDARSGPTPSGLSRNPGFEVVDASVEECTQTP